MEAFVYAANFLYLCSYLVKDIMHLRLLTIVAACCLVTYFYNQAEPLMTVVGWNLFFVALNVFQLIRIFRERAAKRINPKESETDAYQYDSGSTNFEILSGIAYSGKAGQSFQFNLDRHSRANWTAVIA